MAVSKSPLIEKVKHHLKQVRGRHLTIDERCLAAIEMAALMIEEAEKTQSREERKMQLKIKNMVEDENGKNFTISMTDQCFRSRKSTRVADQILYLLEENGIPTFLPFFDRMKLRLFKILGCIIPQVVVPFMNSALRCMMARVIFPEESRKLLKHLRHRYLQKIRVNLNHLGDAVLGEKEAQHRFNLYLQDLANPEIECISVKISTICNPIKLLVWEDTIELLAERLRQIYRAARDHTFIRSDSATVPKFVNLDMEEYRDCDLTIAVFKKVLDEDEFLHFTAGIALQAYLPDAFEKQKKLTLWAQKRMERGGAPIKLRLVKGANLAMEHLDAALHGWPQAPYNKKTDADANFKRMLIWACEPDNAKAVHIGVASHNLFDIAFALFLRVENEVEDKVGFEMLAGMADSICRVVHHISGDMLLYCPVAKKEGFHNAIAYLIRRLDENTGPENFLRHSFAMKHESKEWDEQKAFFKEGCKKINSVSSKPRRSQNRKNENTSTIDANAVFENEPDTDWSLQESREWAQSLGNKWITQDFTPIVPLVIGGENIYPKNDIAEGTDPSRPGSLLYKYYYADEALAEKTIETAYNAQDAWMEKTPQENAQQAFKIAQAFRKRRGDLIGVMMADTGKTVEEADSEVSEAIDFIEYYRRKILDLCDLKDIAWKPKGTVLVATPWNFPCAIPVGGIIASLLTGNTVIFKPAKEAVLVAWHLIQIFWNAGIPKEVLQFIVCHDNPIGTQLISDERVNTVILTGATDTAKMMKKQRPDLDLHAETGGKNAIIITSMADRDLAVKDLVTSAFGHAGQKCSAASIAICEKEVYDDPSFKKQLVDAVSSLSVGPAWNLKTDITPLINIPGEVLKKGLTQLDRGEKWLLEPKQDSKNHKLWSPGIKIGVKEGSFTHQTELFGPVLAIMRAKDLKHAIALANGTKYGLTSGLHSLDKREWKLWIREIQAGNLYINRTITGAIVRRQPFGGVKESSFGPGTKPGGPSYLMELMQAHQQSLPKEKVKLREPVRAFLKNVQKHVKLSPEEDLLLKSAVGSYAFWWRFYERDHDPTRLIGQDNILKHIPKKSMTLRFRHNDNMLDLACVCLAVIITGGFLEISLSKEALLRVKNWKLDSHNGFRIVEEDEFSLLGRIREGTIKHLRLLSHPNEAFTYAAAEGICHTIGDAVLANGRVELMHYMQEIIISINYHRYGNLSHREKEKRKDKLLVS